MKVPNPIYFFYAVLSVAPLTFGLVAGLFIAGLRELMGDPLIEGGADGTLLFLTYFIPMFAGCCYLYTRRSEIIRIMNECE